MTAPVCACDIEHELDEATCPSCSLPTGHESPPCDACGARVAGVARVTVEGIACDLCPTCQREGAEP